MKKLDSLDIELLKLLIEDSSLSYVSLAEKLGVHKDTVRKRMKNLIGQKVIERFTVSLNHDKLTEMYPTIIRVVYAANVIRQQNAFVRELLENKSVIEVDEATPSASLSVLIHTEFKNMNEFRDFTNWLKSSENVDSSNLTIIPVYRQFRRRKRIVQAIESV